MADPIAVPNGVERRRAARAALHLDATMRDGSRKSPARVIDMSTHGCRIECSTVVADDSKVWLGIDGPRRTSIAGWPGIARNSSAWSSKRRLSEAVFERLLQDQGQLPEKAIHELRSIASRTNWLARKAGDAGYRHPRRNFAPMRRKCGGRGPAPDGRSAPNGD